MSIRVPCLIISRLITSRMITSGLIALSPLLFWCDTAIAKNRTTEDFQDYASRRMADVDDKQLVAFVKLVDKNDDGEISDTEFASRVEAYQQLFKSAQPKHRRQGHGLPDNWLTDFKKAREASIESDKPIVAMFSASWCGPCKKMIATVYPTDEAMNALESFVPVYIDSEKQRELAAKNNINSFPTFICFDIDGVAVERHSGGGSVEKFTEMLARFKVAELESKEEKGETESKDQ